LLYPSIGNFNRFMRSFSYGIADPTLGTMDAIFPLVAKDKSTWFSASTKPFRERLF